MALQYDRIKAAAESYKPAMVRFLREMISYPSESTEEKEVVLCIKAEMERLGFEKVQQYFFYRKV
jgi:acetylornithine deacetylase/succinyl-diaminopimelate desuccinylase-like protein